jgi:hypothetical protein
LERYEDYFKHAKLMTNIHAKDTTTITTQRVHENENVNNSCLILKIPEKVIETKRNLRRL